MTASSDGHEGSGGRIAPDYIEQEQADAIDDAVPTRGYHSLPVVALGGSAGAIRALQHFFEAMPPESGFAFVVVVHLSPSHESALPLLIERWTQMPVKTARDREKLVPNSVYVIPPGKHLSANDGSLRVTELEHERGKRVAVDLFFRSLADSHGPHATAIVLSGADGDGAIGIKRIKERGGLTIAQEPAEAEQHSMPQSAIATGMVDWVLPTAAIPSRLLDYFQREKRLGAPPLDSAEPGNSAPVASEHRADTVREILSLLYARTGRDFSYYKRATVVRRIARRVQVNALEDIPAYLEFLRTHPGESGALLQDLLISVTNFFRDREVFEALEAALPALFRDKGPGDSVRVWVPACATGEEAYSMAILLAEQARRLDAPPAVQIFGCDLDAGAIQVARAALYTDSIAADVSEERLRRFFSKDARGYRVRRELRELVLFAHHDLLKDAPFSRMDLVSCRNLLIYLSGEAQRRAVETFHFSLRPGGVLLLGASETIEEGSALFDPIDKKHRIYRQRPLARGGVPLPLGTSSFMPDPIGDGPVLPARSFSTRALWAPKESRARNEGLPASELHLRLLERVGPASLVVNADYEIVHLSKTAGEYLEFASGEPSMNVLRMVHPMLRTELRAALFQAVETGEAVEVANVPVALEGEQRAVTLRVTPGRELAPGYMLVSFESQAAGVSSSGLESEQGSQRPVVDRLERELDLVKARLRDNLEQYEANTEELKASNEELHAMNEELRSATEEIETSREELQSVNEELAAVNTELKSKLDELAHANSDLHNLMASTAIPTIFLDRELRIMRYTPTAVGLFSIIGSDIGRPLADLRHRLDYDALQADAQRVLDHLAPIEREVTAGSEHYLARVLPYRTVEDQIAGVVLTFVNITNNKRVESELRESQARLQLIVENARDYAIFSLDLDRRITSWNSGAYSILGYTADEALGRSADIIFTHEDREAGAPEQEARRALADRRAVDQRWHIRKDGSRFWGSGTLMTMHDAQNRAVGFVKVFRDETEERHAKDALEKSRQELVSALAETNRARAEAEAAGRAKDHFLAVLSHELRTPLTPVLMAARALSRRQDLPPQAYDALAMIERNVQLEAHFIDDLLDITRISRGKFEVVKEHVDVHDAVLRAVEISRADIDGKSQKLELELSASKYCMRGDPRRVQQVFWNLLKNASKFTPEGGSIRVGSLGDERAVRIEVSDSGAGFEPDARERIFAAFEQASEAVAREFGGLGLGLAIAKATVEAHGGTIRANSAGPGTGATFTVEFPLAEEEKEHD
jgi:two-component system CheB/CheR fusion protein